MAGSPSPDAAGAAGRDTTADPFELWKQLYEANERAWGSALEAATATPAFAESQGKLLETFVAAQKVVRDNTRAYLEMINVPTREDIARLGELIVGLEEKIDQLDDRLARIEATIAKAGPAATSGKDTDGDAPRARRSAATDQG